MKKTSHTRHGQLAPRDVPLLPWSEVHCDQIGLWDFKVNGLAVKVRALTIVDPVTHLVEIVRVRSTKSEESTTAFENTWLCRYPLPQRCVADWGPEFRGNAFNLMLEKWKIARPQSSTRTPTANSVIESTHRAMGQILRTLFDSSRPRTMVEMDALVEEAIAITMRACRCASHSSLQGLAPGALVFGRDMHLNIPLIADIIAISENKQLQTDLRLMRENSKRTRHEYRVGEQVYVQNQESTSDKLKAAWVGPFRILQVHTNGNVTIERGQIHERMSIRRLKPA
jgi:transposase InsO family protein